MTDEKPNRRSEDQISKELDLILLELHSQREDIIAQGNTIAAQNAEYVEHYEKDEVMHLYVNESVVSMHAKIDGLVASVGSIQDFIVTWNEFKGFKSILFYLIRRVVFPVVIIWELFTGGVHAGLKSIVEFFR